MNAVPLWLAKAGVNRSALPAWAALPLSWSPAMLEKSGKTNDVACALGGDEGTRAQKSWDEPGHAKPDPQFRCQTQPMGLFDVTALSSFQVNRREGKVCLAPSAMAAGVLRSGTLAELL